MNSGRFFLAFLVLCPSVVLGYDSIQLKKLIAAPASLKGFAPASVAFEPGGRLWVADTGRHALHLFGLDGELTKTVGGPGAAPGQFASPHGIAVDLEGRIYVADSGNHRVQVL